ncbi:hypothetical protein ALI22I_10985 [Saccharothrix sp. ALI-22-I]|uniref:VTT domain-containing protein n=1 Tax=Saccharothrix sp. ALI-22-I TaxID=1933778 RepID=UPI00097C4030|nr:VTT domain-containing protein [Saccharothrix sp. ALI-22-I]ONI90944.1 hypothetical protein ALI22I_10985 [Saccharothrix sp. ALI-22-I]
MFCLLCAVGTAAFFPKPVLAAASGLLFGILPGLAIAVVGFTAGALIAFYIARLVGRPSVARRLGHPQNKITPCTRPVIPPNKALSRC